MDKNTDSQMQLDARLALAHMKMLAEVQHHAKSYAVVKDSSPGQYPGIDSR